MTRWIQEDDSLFDPGMSGLMAVGLQILTGFGLAPLVPKGALWGSGIGAGKLLARLGIAGAAAFIIGMEVGMIVVAAMYLLDEDWGLEM